MVAEHFLERGYKHFGFVGPLSRAYSQRRADAFFHAVGHADGRGHTFNCPAVSRSSIRWDELRSELADWLSALPKPIGIFSWDTDAGAQVIDQCRYRRFVVPDEVAVLSGDADPLICATTAPPMSGLVLASEQIGSTAAEILGRMMSGKPGRLKSDAGTEEVFLEPTHIVARGSTDAMAVADEELRRAVIFLRQNAYGPLTVQQVADFVPMARRSFERKFREAFERSPLQEIRRLRIQRARELLAQTDLPVADIADRAGFGTLEYLSTTFREVVGQTPLRYRSMLRGR